MRILVADDDPSLQVAIRMVLELAEHDVTLAGTVDEARSTLAADDFDAVLVDAGIAGSGVSLWKELVTDRRYHGRTLLITGDLPGLGALERHEAVVGKPFDYDVLIERIDAMGPRSEATS